MEKNKIKLLLSKQNNTRSFAHLKTSCGKTIRPDIIRSNILTRNEQISKITTRQIKTIIDLRLAEEGATSINPAFPNALVIPIPILFGNLSPNNLNEWLLAGDIEKIESFLENGYRKFITDFNTEIKQFFNELLNTNNLPLVFHCSAGKDRTGVLSVLFLMGLGVSKDDAINDYLVTNSRIDIDYIVKNITAHFANDPSITLPAPVKSQKALEMVMGVKREWIEIFIDEIETNFKNIPNYLSYELGINLDELKKIYLN